MRAGLQSLSFEKCKSHLDEAVLDEAAIDTLVTMISRNSSLVIRIADSALEAKRNIFLDELAAYISLNVSKDNSSRISTLKRTIQGCERGYRGIVGMMTGKFFPTMPPPERAWSLLHASADHFLHVARTVTETVTNAAHSKEFMVRDVVLHSAGERDVTADSAIDFMMSSLAASLALEKYDQGSRNRVEKIIVPLAVSVQETQLDAARWMLGISNLWAQWRRLEERTRVHYLTWSELSEQDIKSRFGDNVPFKTAVSMLPDNRTNEIEQLFMAADIRLTRRIITRHQYFALDGNNRIKLREANYSSAFSPAQFLSSEEFVAYLTFEDFLGFDIKDHKAKYLDLLLIEWLRGFAILQTEAQRVTLMPQSSSTDLLPLFTAAELLSFFKKGGMNHRAALAFIEVATLTTNSRDIFDAPLILLEDGRYCIFLAGLAGMNLTLVVTSALRKLGLDIEDKGGSFEIATCDRFRANGINAQRFKISVDREEFDYDCLIVYENILFLFECKNRWLPGLAPLQIAQGADEIDAQVFQIKRLERGIRNNYAEISKRMGCDVSRLQLVSCVLNSLPFAMRGKKDDIIFTDAATLWRFFSSDRHLAIFSQSNINEKTFKQSYPLYDMWEGDRPSALRLISYLEDSPLYKSSLTKKRTEAVQIGDNDLAITTIVVPKVSTLEEELHVFNIEKSDVINKFEIGESIFRLLNAD